MIRRSALASSGLVLVIKVAALSCNLVLSIVLARTMTAGDFGVYSIGMSWLLIAATVSCFGSETVALRQTAVALTRNELNSIRNVIVWGYRRTLFIGTIIAACSVLIWMLVEGRYLLETVAFFTLSVPFAALSTTSGFLLRGADQFLKSSLVEFLLRPTVFLLFYPIVYLYFDSDISVYATAFTVFASQLFVAIVALRWIGKEFGVWQPESPVEFTDQESSAWARSAMTIGVNNILVIALGNIGVILCGMMLASEESGIFRVALQLSQLVLFPFQALNTVIASPIVRLKSSGNLEKLQRMIFSMSIAVILVSLPVAAMMLFFGEYMLSIFGGNFIQGYTILSILVFGQVVNILCGPGGQLLTMTGHQMDVLVSLSCALLVQIVLSLLLSEDYGLRGLAISQVLGIATWNIMLTRYSLSRMSVDPSIFGLTKVLFTSTRRANRT